MGSEFMDAFAADLKKELQIEIQKFGWLVIRGQLPLTEAGLSEAVKKEASVVESDLAAAFRRDLAATIDKEKERLRKLAHCTTQISR